MVHRHLLQRLATCLAVLLSICPRIADAQHGKPLLTVSPVDEIEIISPKVDPEGKPRLTFVRDPATGTLQVEVPPTVIMHRYYYTGDREFQGPYIPGGACVIVANHPQTGAQLAVEAQLLPGAPRIHYTRNAIVYEYQQKTIAVRYGGFFHDTRVVIRDKGPGQRIVDARDSFVAKVANWTRRTGAHDAAKHVATGTSDGLSSAADRIHDAGEIVSTPIVFLWESSPLRGMLTPEQLPQSAGEPSRGIVDELNNTVPTR